MSYDPIDYGMTNVARYYDQPKPSLIGQVTDAMFFVAGACVTLLPFYAILN